MSGHHERSRLAQPESRLAGKRQPDVPGLVAVASGLTGLRADAQVSEVADRRAVRLGGAINHDHPLTTAHRGIRGSEAHDSGADNGDVVRAVHRNTFRIHIEIPSMASTVIRIMRTIAVTIP